MKNLTCTECFCGAPTENCGLCANCTPKAMGIGRMLMALIFVVGGYEFLVGFNGRADMLANMDYVIPLFNVLPGVLMALVGVVLKLGGGISLFLGYKTRYAALALIVYVTLATLMFHIGDSQMTNFLKNISIIGGLLYIMAVGPGAWAHERKTTAPVATAEE